MWETFQVRSRCCVASKCSCDSLRRREMLAKRRSSLLGIGVRPHTYAAAMADLKTRCARVGVDGSRFGIHGIRVAGYNASVRANAGHVSP